MRVTLIKAINELYNYANSSPLKAMITGSLYKLSRPLNSQSEDMTITGITINNDQMQEGVLNWNIHVPNIHAGGINQDDTLPNTLRIDQLSDSFSNNVPEPIQFNGGLSNIFFDSMNIFPNVESREHIINLRFSIYSANKL